MLSSFHLFKKDFFGKINLMIKRIANKLDTLKNLRFFKKHSNCSLPYCIKLESGKPGPSVLIIASIHGNEVVGANFARLFIKHLKKKDYELLRGTVYIVLGNPEAHKKNRRFIDSDLNRSFLSKKDLKLYEHKRAEEIEKYFANKKIDYVIDLHSVSIGDNKMLIIHRDILDDLSFMLKKTKLDTVFVYKDNDIPGIAINHFIKKHRALALSVECGNHFSRSATETAKHEVYLLLSKLNMLNIETKERKHPLTIYKTLGFIKTGPKFKWTIKPKTGLKLKAGQIFAKDAKNGEHKAPKDCTLVMPSKSVSEKDHDAGFLCEEVRI